MGYPSYADYALVDRMARYAGGGRAPAASTCGRRRRRARAEERDALSRMAASRGADAPIEPWDWRYYAEKVRQARYAVDDAVVKPYFRAGAHRRRPRSTARSGCSACASLRAPS